VFGILIVHKTPSRLPSYDYKLRFNFWAQAIFISVFFKNSLLEQKFNFKNNFTVQCLVRNQKTLMHAYIDVITHCLHLEILLELSKSREVIGQIIDLDNSGYHKNFIQ
jgi:hypothetical protein